MGECMGEGGPLHNLEPNYDNPILTFLHLTPNAASGIEIPLNLCKVSTL